MGKKKISDDVDLRKLPKAKRPKPTSGQSAEPFTLTFDDLGAQETRVVKALNAPGEGRREVRAVSELAKTTRLTALQVRNAMRRLVPSRWVERVESVLDDEGREKSGLGHYRITEAGRKRVDVALS